MQIDVDLSLIKLSLGFDDALKSEIKEQYQVDENALMRQAIRSVHRAARYFGREFKQAVKGLDIPIKPIRKRVRIRPFRGLPKSTLWFGLLPFDPAKFNQALVRTGSGTQVGKHFFEQAFPAYTKKQRSKYGVWERIDKRRMPIRKVSLDKSAELESIIDDLEFATEQFLLNDLKTNLQL